MYGEQKLWVQFVDGNSPFFRKPAAPEEKRASTLPMRSNRFLFPPGFPTLYWAPAGSKTKPSKYTGGRELDAFVEYIEENSTQLKLDKNEKDEL